MVQMTTQVSEELAKRLKPIGRWLPTVLDLGLQGACARVDPTLLHLVSGQRYPGAVGMSA